MVVERGDVWWADLPLPRGSEPGFRRPVLIVQSNTLNESRIRAVVVAVITSNVRLAEMPGNVVLKAPASGLDKDSVVNVTQLFSLDRSFLVEKLGHIGARLLKKVEGGLRLVLDMDDP